MNRLERTQCGVGGAGTTGSKEHTAAQLFNGLTYLGGVLGTGELEEAGQMGPRLKSSSSRIKNA
jgi:hypothetical protein